MTLSHDVSTVNIVLVLLLLLLLLLLEKSCHRVSEHKASVCMAAMQ